MAGDAAEVGHFAVTGLLEFSGKVWKIGSLNSLHGRPLVTSWVPEFRIHLTVSPGLTVMFCGTKPNPCWFTMCTSALAIPLVRVAAQRAVRKSLI
jgi:hypothetical protein